MVTSPIGAEGIATRADQELYPQVLNRIGGRVKVNTEYRIWANREFGGEICDPYGTSSITRLHPVCQVGKSASQ